MSEDNERLIFSKNLNYYMDKFNKSQADIVVDLGVNKSTISTWCNGTKMPRMSTIQALADYFKIRKSDLVEDKSKLPKDAILIDGAKLHRIPILGCIAAGLPIYADQNIEGYTYTELNGGAEYFGLRVKGDSMDSLRICDGDVIIVRRQSAVENGDIAVVLVDNENATVKQFFQDGTKVTLVPRSNNPEHLPQFYDLKETSINVLGKVVRNQINF